MDEPPVVTLPGSLPVGPLASMEDLVRKAARECAPGAIIVEE